MTHFDSLQVGSAVTSATAATVGHIVPHPLQIAVWIVALAAGLFSLYRGVMAHQREQVQQRQENENQ
jgi:predicted amino acid dehydrogenase